MRAELDDELRHVTELWRERFGEPPPILTDVDLMRSVLRDLSPESRAEPTG
jgi:hypothetical protein